ncbi:hypothetical protein FEM48_Zijuj04G0101600 [Ziziphus jujuba var. spinosa]|uniref:t-SNARE coiled-coil homology domain-containing protein n=1 Tax=Ziziphus jujuba var. spinosa TaxID=714518 RepID=A0A978VJ98_ZIZJJ|nr:hypothetical protein FEM48_Zijuj04G0101600 [Ziziphus jujuba var. spinosa]
MAEDAPTDSATTTTASLQSECQEQDQPLPSQNPNMPQEVELQENPRSEFQPTKALTFVLHDPHDSDHHKIPQDPEDQKNSLEIDHKQKQQEVESDGSEANRNNESQVAVAAAAVAPAVTTTTTTSNNSVYRRGTKRKKMAMKRIAQEKKSQKKLEVLNETLKPIPFVPAKSLDFSNHEKLLKRLGLWDFVHIEFDRSIRTDLLAQLIANFSNTHRCSYVNGVRIMVNRADLARALKLPVKKIAGSDAAEEVPVSEESIAFIEEFVSNWILLHEDTWMMPSEVLNWTKEIKEGNLEKFDWARLLWFMVEKELTQAPKLTSCYYASHLQCLIKAQREELLLVREEEDKVKVDIKDEEEEEDEEEEDANGDVKMGGDDDIQGHVLQEHNIELSLGQDNVIEKVDMEKDKDGDVLLDFEGCKEDESAQWLLDGKSSVGELYLRRCNLVDERVDLRCEDERKQEEEEERRGGEGEEEDGEEEDEGEEEEEEEMHEQDGGFHLSPRGISLDGLSSASLIQAMETTQIAVNTGMPLRDHFASDFLSSRDDTRMLPGSSSLFGNGNKREISHDNDISHQSLNVNKRLRTDNLWDSKSSSEIDVVLEQMQQLMGKARMICAAKEQACEESSMNQQILLTELQRRDNMIDQLHKAKMDEQQKRQMEVYRLERELYVMANLLEGYRKALKETNRAFAEYRARCPQLDEPLYKDVTGSGGLVLSSMELEKQRLKLEEEERLNRMVVEKKIKDFEVWWDGKFEAHMESVHSLANKFLSVEKEIKLLKESFAKRRVQEPQESVQEIRESVQDTSESVQEIRESVQDTSESVQEIRESVQDTSESVQETPVSVQETPVSVQETQVSVQETPISAPNDV